MSVTFDPVSVRLIEQLQTELPLVAEPFAEIGRRVGLDESDVIDRVKSLRAGTGGARGVIRQISAIFDSRLLGYQSTLVAAKVDPNRIDEAAAEINKHPGVSHNYRRDHGYNLWYTIAVPPDSRFGLERSVQILHEKSGAISSRLMPALKMYKIGVKFDLSENPEGPSQQDTAADGAQRLGASAITDTTRQLVRVLQKDLPAESRPFDRWAAEVGITVPQLLKAGSELRASGIMRRFSAVLRHRQVGFSANAMGVWAVPPGDCDRFGQIAAGSRAVSHCYRRPTYEDWPYSLYTMVHAPTLDAAHASLAAISQATGYQDYSALFSTHEYKKVRVKYFAGDIEAWEQEAEAILAGGAA
jgi:DNA-binding Lrp family transcriptional regulator